MDMKKLLQTIDNAATTPKVETGDMKRFVSIISEGSGKLNRLTSAESIAVNHYTTPTLNTVKDAKPSMIGKYFKKVSEEFEDSAVRSKDRATQLAEIVTKKINESSRKSKAKSKVAESIIEVSDDPSIDTVTLDIPLLIRLLEFAREDAGDDMALHSATENLINLSKEFEVLSMDQYDAIVGEQKALPAPDENKDGKEDY
jgi:hypothetical protein